MLTRTRRVRQTVAWAAGLACAAFASACREGDSRPAKSIDLLPVRAVLRPVAVARIEQAERDSLMLPAQGASIGGTLVIVDAIQADLKVLDKISGRLLRTIGKAGDGPGEFRSPIAIATLDSGRYAVLDGRRENVSLFDSTGAFLSSFDEPGFWVSIGVSAAEHRILLSGSPAPSPTVRGVNQEIHELDDRGRYLLSYEPTATVKSTWEATLNHTFLVMVGRTVVAGRFTSNTLDVIDRPSHRTQSFQVAPGWYRPIEWPGNHAGPTGESGVQRVDTWIRTQNLMVGAVALTRGRLLVRFEAYEPSGTKIYRYALFDTTGKTLAVTQASRNRILAASGDTVYGIEMSPAAPPTLITSVVDVPVSSQKK